MSVITSSIVSSVSVNRPDVTSVASATSDRTIIFQTNLNSILNSSGLAVPYDNAGTLTNPLVDGSGNLTTPTSSTLPAFSAALKGDWLPKTDSSSVSLLTQSSNALASFFDIDNKSSAVNSLDGGVVSIDSTKVSNEMKSGGSLYSNIFTDLQLVEALDGAVDAGWTQDAGSNVWSWNIAAGNGLGCLVDVTDAHTSKVEKWQVVVLQS